jgi:iron complex transport system substrate-binding protein
MSLARRPLAVLIPLLTAVVLTSCGVDENAAGKAPADARSEPGSVFPVSVEHKYGTTEITAKPERIVTLGLSDHDVVLALGEVPVGAIDWFKERPYGKFAWAKDLWGDTPPEIVGERDDYLNEKILNLDPDLILAQYSGMTKEQYDELSKFAPVVAQPVGFEDYGAPWQDMALLAGKAMGMEEETNKLISDIDERFAAVREAHPDWQGKSVAVVDPYEPGKYAIFQKTDPKAAFLEELGFAVPDTINEAAGTNNAAEVSTERSDLIDQDLLVVLSFDPAAAQTHMEADPIYQGLAVAQEKRAMFVPYAEPDIGAALSFNTVLSIPYAIDEFVPLLEQQ